jgi:hypothetical protein
MASMLKLSVTTMVATFFVAVVLGTGSAQAILAGGSNSLFGNFTLTFDETGNGFFQTHDTPVERGTLRGSLQPDPLVPARQVLTWILPPGNLVAVGDVRIRAGNDISDILRFTNEQGAIVGGFLTADRMILYSGLPEAGESPVLGDTGLPQATSFNDGGGAPEVGPEGDNGFQWVPNGVDNNVYIGRSDGVIPEPEPSGIALVITALGVLGVAQWQKRRKLPIV